MNGVNEKILRQIASSVGKTGLTAEDMNKSLRNLGVDSFSMIVLISWLETEFRMTIPDTDVTPENFGTTATLVRYVESRVNRD